MLGDAASEKNNFTIEYSTEKCGLQYGLIDLFICVENDLFLIVEHLNQKKSDFKPKTTSLNVNNAFKKFDKFFKIVKRTQKHFLIHSNTVRNKCILVPVKKHIYLTPLVDLSEID
jgi:hypothetical protein